MNGVCSSTARVPYNQFYVCNKNDSEYITKTVFFLLHTAILSLLLCDMVFFSYQIYNNHRNNTLCFCGLSDLVIFHWELFAVTHCSLYIFVINLFNETRFCKWNWSILSPFNCISTIKNFEKQKKIVFPNIFLLILKFYGVSPQNLKIPSMFIKEKWRMHCNALL